jgi:sugar phosphate permease
MSIEATRLNPLSEPVIADVKVGKLRLWICVVTFLAYLVAFIDRANVAVLIADNTFTNAFGMTQDKSLQGMLLTAFLLFYGIACFFAGPAVNRFGPRKTLSLALTCWAVLMAVMGSVSSVVILLICRALLGLSESVLGPCTSKLVQTWFPVHERAKANGAWYFGIQLSQIISMPLIAWWVATFGWRESLFMLALLGAIPIIPCVWFVYNSPSLHPKITKEEVAYITGGGAANDVPESKIHKSVGEFTFVRNKYYWLNTFIFACLNAGLWGFMGWVPTYFKATLGFSFTTMGLLASLPYVAGSIALAAFSPLMDKFNSRATFVTIGCLGFAILLFVAMYAESRTACIILLCLAQVCLTTGMVGVWTVLQNVTKSTEVANATGFFNGTAYMVASVFPYAMGALYSFTGNLRNGFFLLVGMMLLAAIAGIPLMKRRL